MSVPRRTIAREVSVEGRGLHEGEPARLTISPAAAGTGVRFRRSDIAASEPIPVHLSALKSQPRRTAIARGEAEVHTVEHFMAAVTGLGLTDLDVAIDRVEVPGLDGSAREFEAALRSAGVRDLGGPAPVLRLDRTVAVEDKSGARIVALPCPGRLVLDYTLDYGGECPRARVVVDVTEESFAREIAPARTFCLEKEALALQAAGLGRGADTTNTLVIGKDGLPIQNALRFPDEYARHKALDLLGDLALLGARLEARVVAYKAGHALNAALVRELLNLVPAPVPVRESFAPPAIAFEGHFPGDPVLPGIVTLAALRGGAPVQAIESAKFRRIVRPGESLAIERTPAGEGRVRARALAAGGEVAVEAVFVREP